MNCSHSLDSSLLILIFLIFLSFFFLIRGILLFLANPERLHQRRLKKRLRAMEGLESSLNVNTLLKKASLEKSFLDQILVKFSLFNRIQIMMLQANLTWKMGTFLVVAASVRAGDGGGGTGEMGGLGSSGRRRTGFVHPLQDVGPEKEAAAQKV